MAKYTQPEIDFVISLRDMGREYQTIAREFERSFGRPRTEEQMRHAYRKHGAGGATPPPRPTTAREPRRLLRRRDVELLAVDPKREAARNERILLISDLHVPYQHPDAFYFLEELAKKYQPTRVVCLGDEVDHHAMSFHDSDPDLLSAGDELTEAIGLLKFLYEKFPEVDLVDSNHGSMAYRKGKHFGMPRKYLRDYGEVLEAPDTWTWHLDLMLDIPGGRQLYIHHGLAEDAMKVVAQRGVCVVQGHFHNAFRIGYLGNPNHLLWGMSAGCLINGRSLAFAYDSVNLKRPVVGTGLVIDGLPHLAPMVLDRHGRWTGRVP